LQVRSTEQLNHLGRRSGVVHHQLPAIAAATGRPRNFRAEAFSF
jgi:hypothetical protein